MNNSSQTLEQKQTYLRSQIIDAGVDPEPFMIYMGAYKGQGQNINLQNWTLPELKKVVQQFKQSLQLELKRQQIQMSKITGQQAANNYRSSRQVADRVMGSNLPKKQKVFYERDDLWDYQLKTRQQCKKTYNFFDFKSYPHISVKGIQVKKSGGFLFGIIGAKSYIQITLAPNFSSNAVARKSQDVDWLRSNLVALYPGSFVPPLQQTPATLQLQRKEVVAKRAKQVLDFLNSLVHFDYLINNKFTHMFFTENDLKAFQNFKQKFVTTPVNSLNTIQNLQGSFPIQISQRIQHLVKNTSRYSKQVSVIYRNIQQTLGKLQTNYNSITDNYRLLAKDLHNLKQKYGHLSQRCNFAQSQQNVEFDRRMIAMVNHVNDLVQNLSTLAHKQASTIREINDEHIRVIIKQWSQFDNVQARYKKQLDSYLTLRLAMTRKKQQFFLDLSKKQLQQREKTGVSNQTTLGQKQEMYRVKYSNQNRVQQQRRKWQGYINHVYEKSFIGLLNQQQKRLQSSLGKASRKFGKLLSEVAQKHNTFQKYLNDEATKIIPAVQAMQQK